MQNEKFNNKNMLINIAMVIVIAIASLIVLAISLNSIIKESKETTTELLSDSLYHSVESRFDTAVGISEAMGFNSFLVEYLEDENNIDEITFENKITSHLNSIKQSTNLEIVYCVTTSKKYFTNEGYKKTIVENPTDSDYDIWYYTFLDSDKREGIDINNLENNTDSWTLFTDFKILNESNDVIGVCGVGFSISSLQDELVEYEKEFNVKLNFTDSTGKVVVDANNINIDGPYLNARLTEESNTKYSYYENGAYIVSKYLENVGWYLVVINSQNVILGSLPRIIIFVVVAIFLVTVLIISINYFINNKQRKSLMDVAIQDELTGCYNRVYLNQVIQKKEFNKNYGIMMMDINNLKNVNDTKGHIKGDEYIVGIVSRVKELVPTGLMFRIGGDEFIVLVANILKDDFNKLALKCKNDEILSKNLAIGYMYVDTFKSFKEIEKLVDKKMYSNKKKMKQ